MSHLLAVRKGEDVMSTMTGHLRRTTLWGVVGILAVLGIAKVGRADVASDKPGAILIYPKIVVDTSGILGPPTDTEIQITNTSNQVVGARCYLIDSTSHCSNTFTCSNDRVKLCTSNSDCGSGQCVPAACTAAGLAEGREPGRGGCLPGGTCLGPCSPRLVETDFRLTLTKRQPVSWKASEGLRVFPCDETACVPPGANGQAESNGGSSVPGVQEEPFVGVLKCVQAKASDFTPSNGLDPANGFTGDLKGEATIVSTGGALRDAVQPTSPFAVDARKYNAIGIQSIGLNNGDDTLLVGGATPEYNACPKAVIVDNLFDYATVATHGGGSVGQVTTDLTFIPCTEDLATQTPTGATLQFLVYNEFEQRFSTSIGFSCFKEVQLSDIDTRPGIFGNQQSIFSYMVQGTLSGQIRIRPVPSATTDNRILAVSEEFWTCASGPDGTCSAAANVNLVPGIGNGDEICLEGATPDQGCTVMSH